MATLCPSSVPVKLGDTWLDKLALDKVLGTSKTMTMNDIDEVVSMFVHGARVAKEAGFAGCQLHGAHGFLISQFLSRHTNRRTDEYGGTPEKRMKLLKRLVQEVRETCPPPFCLSVKLNSADYMDAGVGLQQDEGLQQVQWLLESGLVDFVEISGGNAENKTSKLHSSFGARSISEAPKKRESTRIREAFFTEFAEKVQTLNVTVPVQLSGGFRSRSGMGDAIDSGVCQLVGLGHAAVLEPELPRKALLNPECSDEGALGISHIVRGQWFGKLVPAEIIGRGFGLQFFYYNMRRLGHGLQTDPYASIPWIFATGVWETLSGGLAKALQRAVASLPVLHRVKAE